MNWLGNVQLEQSARALVDLGLREDLGLDRVTEFTTDADVTSAVLIDADELGSVVVVAREPGVISGLDVGCLVFEVLDASVNWTSRAADGDSVLAGDVVACVQGPLRSLLVGERTCLNFLSHMSGIASMTRRLVREADNPDLVVLDTRKTIPGYRLLQKYAVACGGGTNHRLGLFDGILIKDNHLAAWNRRIEDKDLVSAIHAARSGIIHGIPIEVEVDGLDQLREALAAAADIVLLDNMSLEELRLAVDLRNQMAPSVKLEASGNISLETISQVAKTGVDRVSIGALTHSAPALDIGFDWEQ